MVWYLLRYNTLKVIVFIKLLLFTEIRRPKQKISNNNRLCNTRTGILIVIVFKLSQVWISNIGAAVAEWLSSWLAEQEDRGSIPGLATWIFRDWLSPASKSRYGWKIVKSTLILKTTNQQPTWISNTDAMLACNIEQKIRNITDLSVEKWAKIAQFFFILDCYQI